MEVSIPEPVFLEYFHSTKKFPVCRPPEVESTSSITIQHPAYDKIYCYVKTEA